MTIFAERLRAIRQQAGLSQVELAGDDLSPSYISLLESGKRTPSTDVLGQLASRLGCSISQLVDGRPSEREQRLALELAYARLAIEHGESGDAAARLRHLLAETDLLPHVKDEASLLLARACQRLGDGETAVVLLEDLFERARSGLAHVSLVHVATFLSYCYQEAGDLSRASRLGEAGLEAARQQGLDGTDDYFELAATVMFIYAEMGDFLYARALAQRLIGEAEQAGRRAGQAALYWNAAVLAEYEGRLGDALQLSRRALAHMGELESTRDFARLHVEVAGILMVCDVPDVDEARRLLDQCLSDLRDLGGRADLAQWMCVRSAVLLHGGDLVRAEDQAREALALLGDQAGPVGVKAWFALADALTAQGDHSGADDALNSATQGLGALGDGRAIGIIWRELAERLADAKEYDRAMTAFRQALDDGGIRDRSGATRAVVRRYAESPVADGAGVRRAAE